MFLRAHERMLEEQEERDRCYGLQHDPDDEFAHELELADRIAEQASLPVGHPLARAAARHQLGRGPSPYERPHEPPPARFAAGDRVSHHAPDGPQPGRVVRAYDDGLAEADFGPGGTSIVAADQLDPEAA